ncbi:MAG: DmsC/YnfH family molybdoenzyme membrane anchor subunit [Bacteroides sp.]|jgi:DMSO reductase anchor subunit|nr:DmsC/YnfH family molybdoenzyme membrane anchor subunit [Bacteroides sp.]
MQSNEWPLIFFTLLSQLSMGIIFSGLVIFLFVRTQDLTAGGELRRLVSFTAMAGMGVALVLSFLHLGRPLHSVFALGNFGSSFLSREILLVSLFLFSLAMLWSSARFGIPSPASFKILYLASLIAGITLIWTMARLYMIPTVPAWNTPLTVVKFFNSGLLLGAGVMICMVVFLHAKGLEVFQVRMVVSILFFVVALGVFIHLLTTLIPAEVQQASSFPAPVVPFAWKAARLLFLILGFSLLAWWYPGFLNLSARGAAGWAYLAFALLVLSEICGRYIFYASYFRVGV